MIKLIRDFYVNGDDEQVFDTLQKYLPEYLDNHPEDDYKVIDEIQDDHRLYRKSLLKRNSFLKELPNMVIKTLPREFVESVRHITEETVFDRKEKKLNFFIVSDNIYQITGSTRFIPITKEKCKVITMIHFTLLDAEKYFPNKTVSTMLIPLLKAKIPEMFITNQNLFYNEVVKKYKSKP